MFCTVKFSSLKLCEQKNSICYSWRNMQSIHIISSASLFPQITGCSDGCGCHVPYEKAEVLLHSFKVNFNTFLDVISNCEICGFLYLAQIVCYNWL